MDLYRYGHWSDDTGMSFWSIEKRKWWGWKEIQYWAYKGWLTSDKKCKKDCLEAVEVMRKNGFTVIKA